MTLRHRCCDRRGIYPEWDEAHVERRLEHLARDPAGAVHMTTSLITFTSAIDFGFCRLVNQVAAR
jgi:hypothetical protein